MVFHHNEFSFNSLYSQTIVQGGAITGQNLELYFLIIILLFQKNWFVSFFHFSLVSRKILYKSWFVHVEVSLNFTQNFFKIFYEYLNFLKTAGHYCRNFFKFFHGFRFLKNFRNISIFSVHLSQQFWKPLLKTSLSFYNFLKNSSVFQNFLILRYQIFLHCSPFVGSCPWIEENKFRVKLKKIWCSSRIHF